MPPPSVLFVCLGNICRSPLAEAAFRDAVERARIEAHADSAGTGEWHVGRPPDPRSQAEALRHGIDISNYRARRVSPDDFRSFDLILALDPQNLSDLCAIAPADATARVELLMDQVRGRAGEGVPDPYYGDEADFATVWEMVAEAAEALVGRMEPKAASGS